MKVISIIVLCALPALSFALGDHGEIKVELLEQSDKMWNGEKLPAYPAGDAQISVLKVVIPPKAKLAWHKHPCINAGYLISGEVEVQEEGGAVRTVKAGEALIELVDIWHYGRNVSDVPAEIVVVYVGVKDMPLAIMKED